MTSTIPVQPHQQPSRGQPVQAKFTRQWTLTTKILPKTTNKTIKQTTKLTTKSASQEYWTSTTTIRTTDSTSTTIPDICHFF